MEYPYLALFHEVHRLIRSGPVLSDLTGPEEVTTAAEGGREHFRRLIASFAFSKVLILTYQGVLLVIVLLAAAWRWHQRSSRLRRKGQRREHGLQQYGCAGSRCTSDNVEIEETSERIASAGTETYAARATSQAQRCAEGWSSNSSASTRVGSPSSSSRTGNSTPPAIAVKEEDDIGVLSPLLARADRSSRTTPRDTTRMFKPWSWLRAALMYQPQPLPLLRRVLPNNSTTLMVLFLLGLNLFYLLYKIDFGHLSAIDIVSDRAGLMFVANLPWLYLLAAKNQPLKKLTGDSYENLNLYHRRQGEYMCFLAVVHFGGMLSAWYNFLRPEPFNFSLWDFLTIHLVLWGIGAWFAYEVLYLTSLSSFRERCYELFLASHIVLQVVGLGTLWMHHPHCSPYVASALLIFVADRIVWRLGLKSFSLRADLQVMEDGETVKVSANWPVKSSTGMSGFAKRLFARDMQHGWEPTHHVFLTVPALGTKHGLQSHPMTIASAAPTLGEDRSGNAWFNLIIRAKGGFSRDLLNHARVHGDAQIRLDGPYGSLHALEMLRASDIAMIVAGGSGIAVAYPMLWDLLHRKDEHGQKVCLIWIVQDASHVSWIGNERLDELRDLGCHVIMPPPSRKSGRPDVKALLRDTVDELSAEVRDQIGVVVSGPDGMNRDANNACARLVAQGRNVEIAVEKFGW